ncbi:hypothetical protein [Larkinella knui]|uniref:DUF1828 domain-containing protein n=1 Tax=Larkinella knui TaxID=2025310 RepID=A0A3P1CGK2_9BACT|nr:hypothetical protein [Larkinella knui]RRB12370.1 hypothetical protein EHT87_19420 [Larkinella knui]
MMVFEEIYNDIKNAFGQLWTFKERGKSLEIITPYTTTTQKFISVFLSFKDEEYIVSDGGWLDNGFYENTFNLEDDTFRKIAHHYFNAFGIKEVKGPSQKTYFYKKTITPIAVPSLVFDLSNFIAAMVSTSEIEFIEREERETKELFRRSANEYLQTVIPKEKMELGAYLDDKKQIRMHAVIKQSSSRLILINYITGSNQYYFNNSITKTNFLFELAEKSVVGRFVKRKISLIDTTAAGYVPTRIATFINHLLENTGSEKIDWSEREKLNGLI